MLYTVCFSVLTPSLNRYACKPLYPSLFWSLVRDTQTLPLLRAVCPLLIFFILSSSYIAPIREGEVRKVVLRDRPHVRRIIVTISTS